MHVIVGFLKVCSNERTESCIFKPSNVVQIIRWEMIIDGADSILSCLVKLLFIEKLIRYSSKETSKSIEYPNT